jgi:hypothetical protein
MECISNYLTASGIIFCWLVVATTSCNCLQKPQVTSELPGQQAVHFSTCRFGNSTAIQFHFPDVL